MDGLNKMYSVEKKQEHSRSATNWRIGKWASFGTAAVATGILATPAVQLMREEGFFSLLAMAPALLAAFSMFFASPNSPSFFGKSCLTGLLAVIGAGLGWWSHRVMKKHESRAQACDLLAEYNKTSDEKKEEKNLKSLENWVGTQKGLALGKDKNRLNGLLMLQSSVETKTK